MTRWLSTASPNLGCGEKGRESERGRWDGRNTSVSQPHQLMRPVFIYVESISLSPCWKDWSPHLNALYPNARYIGVRFKGAQLNGSWDMLRDRHTDRHAYCSTLFPGDGIINMAANQWVVEIFHLTDNLCDLWSLIYCDSLSLLGQLSMLCVFCVLRNCGRWCG